MPKLAIIHFNPIESYPPVMNLLNLLAAHCGAGLKVSVITMAPAGGRSLFRTDPPCIGIRRAGSAGRRGWRGYLNYLLFYLTAFFHLLVRRPDKVLYYETLSALPAFLYKQFVRRGAELYIHYHEYTSPEEYRRGMRLGRSLHRLEKKLYPKAKWISHTNTDRVTLFSRDLTGTKTPALQVLPNYPPSSWTHSGNTVPGSSGLLRVVYAGALSLDTMYTREFGDWVARQAGKVCWDIYSDNITPAAHEYVQSFGDRLVRLRKGVDYFSLPGILGHYDVGVILYKGHIPNYVYNAPNKLFEYLACGLDVWFPSVMKGCLPFVTHGIRPRVLALDFHRLGAIDLAAVTSHEGLEYAAPHYYAEEALRPLLDSVLTVSLSRRIHLY